MKTPDGDLSELIATLAIEPIRLQRKLDEHRAGTGNESDPVGPTDGELGLFVERARQGGANLEPLLRQLVPPRLLTRSFELSARVRLEVSRKHGFSLTARPINAGYSIIHRSTGEKDSSLTLEVVQVPVLPHQKPQTQIQSEE